MRIGRRINTHLPQYFCSIFLSLNTVSPLYTFINSASDILQFNAIRFGMIISIIANNCCIERSLRIRTICLDNNFTIYNRAMVCYERACLSRRSKSIQRPTLVYLVQHNSALQRRYIPYHPALFAQTTEIILEPVEASDTVTGFISTSALVNFKLLIVRVPLLTPINAA